MKKEYIYIAIATTIGVVLGGTLLKFFDLRELDLNKILKYIFLFYIPFVLSFYFLCLGWEGKLSLLLIYLIFTVDNKFFIIYCSMVLLGIGFSLAKKNQEELKQYTNFKSLTFSTIYIVQLIIFVYIWYCMENIIVPYSVILKSILEF